MASLEPIVINWTFSHHTINTNISRLYLKCITWSKVEATPPAFVVYSNPSIYAEKKNKKCAAIVLPQCMASHDAWHGTSQWPVISAFMELVSCTSQQRGLLSGRPHAKLDLFFKLLQGQEINIHNPATMFQIPDKTTANNAEGTDHSDCTHNSNIHLHWKAACMCFVVMF